MARNNSCENAALICAASDFSSGRFRGRPRPRFADLFFEGDLVAGDRPSIDFLLRPYGQNNYRTLGASDVRRVAASPRPFFMKNRLIVFERAAAANAPTI
jgi:hypothetical protein